ELRLGPQLADGRHRSGTRRIDTGVHDAEERRSRGDQRTAADIGAIAALAEVSVTRRADTVPDLAADRLVGDGVDVVLVGLLRLGLDGRPHRGVEDAAQLGALALPAPLPPRAEPGVVDPAGDRLDLPAER